MKNLKNKATKKIQQSARDYHQSFKRRMFTRISMLFHTRGGSFYGVGYIFTLLFLELKTVIEEFAEFEFTIAGVAGQILEHIIHLSIESVLNIIYASIWPLMIFKQFSKPYNFIILIAIFVTYLLLRNKFNTRSVNSYLNIPEQRVQQIIDAIIMHKTIPDEINTLIQQAESCQLEHWRYQPDSCLALLLLLNFFSKNNSINQSYCEKIIMEALQADLHKHLSFKQQCYFYLPLHFSEKPALIKRAKKLYTRLNKKASQEKLWFKQFSNHHQLAF